MSTFELMCLFYDLPGYRCWNSQERQVVFDNPKSAEKFKQAAPGWVVLYTIEKK